MATSSSLHDAPQPEAGTATHVAGEATPPDDVKVNMLRSRSVGWVLIVVSVLVLIAVMAEWWPLGFDYVKYYRPITERWMAGQTRLYDANSVGLVNGPGILALTIPLALLPIRLGQAVLNVGSLVCILLSVRIAQSNNSKVPLPLIVLGIANLHMLSLLFNGQTDAYILLGVMLTWYATLQMKNTPSSRSNHLPWMASLGLWLMIIKPINVLLAGWMFVIEMRHWRKADILRALSLPAVSFAASLFACGADWPARYLANLELWEDVRSWPPDTPLTSTIWRAASELSVPIAIVIIVCAVTVALALVTIWRYRASLATLSLAVTTNLFVTPYAYGHHYVLLIPAYLFVAGKHRWLGLQCGHHCSEWVLASVLPG